MIPWAGMPDAADAFALSIERVLCGEGNGGDVAISCGAFTLLAGVDVVVVSIGIGADAGNLVFCFEVFVRHTSGYDKHVAFLYLDFPAFFAAQQEGGRACYESKRFVGYGMIMMVGEDTAVPGVAPAMLFKQIFYITGMQEGREVE